MLPTPNAPLNPLSRVNFKYKKWGYYKRWIDSSYLYFTEVEKSLFILRPKPFTPIIK